MDSTPYHFEERFDDCSEPAAKQAAERFVEVTGTNPKHLLIISTLGEMSGRLFDIQKNRIVATWEQPIGCTTPILHLEAPEREELLRMTREAMLGLLSTLGLSAKPDEHNPDEPDRPRPEL